MVLNGKSLHYYCIFGVIIFIVTPKINSQLIFYLNSQCIYIKY